MSKRDEFAEAGLTPIGGDKPQVYETTFRMPELTMLRLRRVYAETYADHELSWNKWLLSMTERGVRVTT